MIRRCENKNHIHFPDYGGRGISVCPKWRNDAAAFAEDMGPRPSGATLDRIDNDKGYSPENCRWATREQQRQNQRAPSYKGRKNEKTYTHDGKTMTVKEWAAHLGMPRVTLDKRIRKGLPLSLVFTVELFASNQWRPDREPRRKAA
jgi:hypothetical protein